MMLVGAGFGLGVALTLSRLLADLAPGLTVAGAVACAAIGLGLTVWVVGTRGLLRDRALLDRWAGEATGLVQSAAEQLVATRVLAAESSLTAALGEQDEGESTRVAEQVSVDRHRAARAFRRRGAGRGATGTGDAGPAGRPRGGAQRARRTAGATTTSRRRLRPTVTGEPSETSVPADADDEEIDEKSPTNTADNVF